MTSATLASSLYKIRKFYNSLVLHHAIHFVFWRKTNFKLLKTHRFIIKCENYFIFKSDRFSLHLWQTRIKMEREKSKMKKIHVIVPAYNESKAILNVLRRIHLVMKDNYDYKITVIDDGSSDDTYEILKEKAKKLHAK